MSSPLQPNESAAQRLKNKSLEYCEKKKKAHEEEKNKADRLRLIEIQRANSGQCAKCGSDKLQAVHSATSKGFNDKNACGGCCLLGPIGLLCGMCGSGKKEEHTYRMCLNCGNKF